MPELGTGVYLKLRDLQDPVSLRMAIEALGIAVNNLTDQLGDHDHDPPAEHEHDPPALDDITDVTIDTPADNELLAYDGVDTWINQTAAEAGISVVGHSHGAGSDPMYGHLYDDNTPSASGITITTIGVFVGLTAMSAGVCVGLIPDLADANGDNLEVPTDGAGDYIIMYSCGLGDGVSQVVETGIHKNGTYLTGAPAAGWMFGTSGWTQNNASMVATLADGDEISLRVANASSNANLTMQAATLTMWRIGV